MARKYGSTRSMKQRKADNAGVKDGTIRKGAGGRTMRRYNAKTGRWQVIKVIDKKGRTKETRKTTTPPAAPDSPSPSPSRPTSRVSPSARGEGSSRKPNKTTTYNPGAGTARPKTPGDKFFDRIGQAIEVRGGNAAKTRGRDAIVKARNKTVVDKRQAARKKREEALKAAMKARAERMRK